jgi:hypothetical protein
MAACVGVVRGSVVNGCALSWPQTPVGVGVPVMQGPRLWEELQVPTYGI